jgi:multiple sugar transport system substrate-binding protein
MPMGGGNSSFYFYSKTLFKNAGLDPEKPPTTWQELEEAAQKLIKKNGNAIDIMGADPTYGANTLDVNFVQWLICNNGALATEDAKTLTFNSAEGVETLEWLVSFTTKINGSYSNCVDFWAGSVESTPDARFYKDRLGIYFYNLAGFSNMSANAPAKYKDPTTWGLALRPYNAKNSKASSRGETGLAASWGQVIPKAISKEKQDAAYRFVEFLSTNDKGVCSFLFAQDRPAPLISCNANPDYKKNNPYWDIVVKALANDMSLPITPVQTQVQTFIKDAVEQALRGVAKPKDALDQAAKQGQAVVDKYWKGA